MLVQKIRPSIRLLCAGIGLVLLTVAVQAWWAGHGLDGLDDAVGFGVFAVVLLALAAMGMLEDDGQPPGNDRFRELADPARALRPEDLRRNDSEPAPVPRETRGAR
jgi:hypothetical protein